MPPGGGAPLSKPSERSGRTGQEQDQEQDEGPGGAGFVVLIEGYSPYKNIAELLDPPMVGDDENRWGIVTRFGNLEKLFPDAPFKLFKKHQTVHFKVDRGLVNLLDQKDMPAVGIGVEKEMERVSQQQSEDTKRTVRTSTRDRSDFVTTEFVLIDPMTGEEISTTYDIVTQQDIDADPDLTDRDLGRKKLNYGKEQFIERDQWFRIQAKFVWKNTPKP